jgi:hypothetical protein
MTATQTKVVKVEIHHDDDAQSPRDNDNLGTMSCRHRRYNLGDEQVPMEDIIDRTLTSEASAKLERWFERERVYRSANTDPAKWDEVSSELQKDYDIAKLKAFEEVAVWLPIYMYDHSSISLSTKPFGCRWDSGQLGIIYVTKENIRKEYQTKRVTKKVLMQVRECLRGEVEEYHDYVSGNVHGYVLKDADDNEVDSCWGFIGDPDSSGMSEYINQHLPEGDPLRDPKNWSYA